MTVMYHRSFLRSSRRLAVRICKLSKCIPCIFQTCALCLYGQLYIIVYTTYLIILFRENISVPFLLPILEGRTQSSKLSRRTPRRRNKSPKLIRAPQTSASVLLKFQAALLLYLNCKRVKIFSSRELFVRLCPARRFPLIKSWRQLPDQQGGFRLVPR